MKLVLKATISRIAGDEDLESILSSAYWSYKWARDHEKGPWPLGEPVIAKDPIFSTLYALECLGLNKTEAENWGRDYSISHSKNNFDPSAMDLHLEKLMKDLSMVRSTNPLWFNRVFKSRRDNE